MKFSITKSIEILERTPLILDAYLKGLSYEWLTNNEGTDTWSPYDIIGHLIFGEKTDWMIRIKIILSDSENKLFEPFDRFAQMQSQLNSQTISKLLNEFAELRKSNIEQLKGLNLTEEDLNREGIHPELGNVTLKHLISSWVVHDVGHISQISRVMAKQYQAEVGPWTKYLGILKN